MTRPIVVWTAAAALALAACNGETGTDPANAAADAAPAAADEVEVSDAAAAAGGKPEAENIAGPAPIDAFAAEKPVVDGSQSEKPAAGEKPQ